MAGEIGSLTADRQNSGPHSWAEGRWHQHGTDGYPANADAVRDLPRLISEHIVRGHAPERPMLDSRHNVVTMGSCFAAELRHFLNQVGLSSDSFWVPSGLNNTFALLDFVSWCVRGEQTDGGFRYDRAADGSLKDWMPVQERERYHAFLRQAGAIVFTIGLAEVWEDTESGHVFWRGIPESVFEAQRHRFRVSTVEENQRNIGAIIDLIREINPQAAIVVTLSPVPLKATFRDVSCMTADCVSKSILRVAIDGVMTESRPGVFYWPSFEIVKWAGCHLPYPVYGADDGVVRHVSRYVVMNILLEFVRRYYGEDQLAEVTARYQAAVTWEAGGPGEPPVLIRGEIVTA